MNKETKELLRAHAVVTNRIVDVFAEKHELEGWYWVRDVVSGVACFIDEYYFEFTDIVLDLELNQPMDFILDWHDDTLNALMDNQDCFRISYASWVMGAKYAN